MTLSRFGWSTGMIYPVMMVKQAEPDFTKWINIPINQSYLKGKCTVFVRFRLKTMIRCFYIIIHL